MAKLLLETGTVILPLLVVVLLGGISLDRRLNKRIPSQGHLIRHRSMVGAPGAGECHSFFSGSLVLAGGAQAALCPARMEHSEKPAAGRANAFARAGQCGDSFYARAGIDGSSSRVAAVDARFFRPARLAGLVALPAAAAWYLYQTRAGSLLHVLGGITLGGGILFACTACGASINRQGDWVEYHLLFTAWAAAVFVILGAAYAGKSLLLPETSDLRHVLPVSSRTLFSPTIL